MVHFGVSIPASPYDSPDIDLSVLPALFVHPSMHPILSIPFSISFPRLWRNLQLFKLFSNNLLRGDAFFFRREMLFPQSACESLSRIQTSPLKVFLFLLLTNLSNIFFHLAYNFNEEPRTWQAPFLFSFGHPLRSPFPTLNDFSLLVKYD